MMATTAAILDLVSVDYLTNVWVIWSDFLAHLQGAYAIMWRPSSSVSTAHFVTAGAIDPKICTYLPLGKSNHRPKLVQSDSWLGHQGAKTKNTKSAITPELMAGSTNI
jgi:hypothetical protein